MQCKGLGVWRVEKLGVRSDSNVTKKETPFIKEALKTDKVQHIKENGKNIMTELFTQPINFQVTLSSFVKESVNMCCLSLQINKC